MIDAYTIGITLALEDGVSAGIAVIRQDLAALDRAVASTAAGLLALRRLGQQASLVTLGDAPPVPASASSPARPALGSAAPAPHRIPSADGSPSSPVPDAPEPEPPARRGMPSGPSALPADLRPHSVLPNQPFSTDPRASVAPPMERPSVVGPGRPQPRPVSEFAPFVPGVLSRSASELPRGQALVQAAAPLPATTEAPTPVFVGAMTGSTGEDVPASMPHSSVLPRAPRLARIQAPPAWSDYAASMHGRLDPVDSSGPRAGAPRTQAPSGHAPPAFAPMAENPLPDTAAPGSAPRHALADRVPHDPDAGQAGEEIPSRAMPSGRSEGSPANFSGQIVLEGSRLGRWMSDGLARTTERPPSGFTGVDPRATPGWPGLHGD